MVGSKFVPKIFLFVYSSKFLV